MLVVACQSRHRGRRAPCARRVIPELSRCFRRKHGVSFLAFRTAAFVFVALGSVVRLQSAPGMIQRRGEMRERTSRGDPCGLALFENDRLRHGFCELGDFTSCWYPSGVDPEVGDGETPLVASSREGTAPSPHGVLCVGSLWWFRVFFSGAAACRTLLCQVRFSTLLCEEKSSSLIAIADYVQ